MESSTSIEVITAPWSIGLRPPKPGVEPGTWRAPEVLRAAGLVERLRAASVVELPRPAYSPEPQPGTRIRNGVTLREHGLRLADAVHRALQASRFPMVVGGDCSVLLGALLGARRLGACGLIHIDGHPDFAHPGNHDFTTLGAVAGMDLALATGRGELLLTRWPGIDGPLVEDHLVVQFGDRTGAEEPGEPTLRIGIDEIQADLDNAVDKAVTHASGSLPLWLHLDLDVLDADVLPAVDSPGSPGLTFDQLSTVLAMLRSTGRILGLNVTIYDPDLDPDRRYAPGIIACLASGLGRE